MDNIIEEKSDQQELEGRTPEQIKDDMAKSLGFGSYKTFLMFRMEAYNNIRTIGQD